AAIDAPVAVIGKEGEDYQALLDGAVNTSPAAEEAAAESAPVEEAVTVEAPAPSTPAPAATDARVKASPLAKKIAQEKGID
ncbi:MAG: E3 binding domain-containing protein, partial [Bacteroidia bacterium]